MADPDAKPMTSIDEAFSLPLVHRVRFVDDVWGAGQPGLAQLISTEEGESSARALVFVDSGVAAAWPGLERRVEGYARAHPAVRLAGPVEPVVGGEACKNDWSLVERIVRAIDRAGLCRRSYVIAVGGGAVLDAVGFATSIAHRGVRLIRIPTTTLAQADSGVGVKNGVNAFGKKNFLGAFGVPWAVVIDEGFLSTLSDRDWLCGFSEAVKVALLKDRGLFDQIVARAGVIRSRDMGASRAVLRRSARLHVEHITRGGDPFELTRARPLDLGHWAGHKLESLSGFRLRHGEAVAIGLAVDVVYSRLTGLLGGEDAGAILGCLQALGFDLYDESMRDVAGLLGGLEEFRQHLGGGLTVTLLEGIGRPVDVHEIDAGWMGEAIGELAGLGDGRERAPGAARRVRRRGWGRGRRSAGRDRERGWGWGQG